MSIQFEPRTHQDDVAYKAALERAEALQGYYIHVVVYAVVNSALFVINVLTKGDTGGWWFIWPLLGWGIGLTIHTLVVFGGLFSEGWKERKAEQIYRRAQHPSRPGRARSSGSGGTRT